MRIQGSFSSDILMVRVMLLVTLAVFLMSGCGGSDSTTPRPEPPQASSYQYSAPTALSDGWQTASLSNLGADLSLLESAVQSMRAEDFGYRRIDGMAIVYEGELVLDVLLRQALDMTDEWSGNQQLGVHAVHSVTKSVMSLTMGIAIEEGLVLGVNQPALDYFAEYAPFEPDGESKQQMTIENWLTMQHGLQWDEWSVNYQDDGNQNLRMINSPAPLEYLFSLPVQSTPGTDYAYSTGISYALGEILARASANTFHNYMQSRLLDPLGIARQSTWPFHGDLHAGSGLYLTLRDMAKIGQLVLDDGTWQGTQVVPSAWIAQSTAQRVQQGNIRYGYQWWLTEFNVGAQSFEAIYASGWGGQLVYVFDELDSVVVFTGRRYGDGDSAQTSIRSIMTDHILPMLLTVP